MSVRMAAQLAHSLSDIAGNDHDPQECNEEQSSVGACSVQIHDRKLHKTEKKTATASTLVAETDLPSITCCMDAPNEPNLIDDIGEILSHKQQPFELLQVHNDDSEANSLMFLDELLQDDLVVDQPLDFDEHSKSIETLLQEELFQQNLPCILREQTAPSNDDPSKETLKPAPVDPSTSSGWGTFLGMDQLPPNGSQLVDTSSHNKVQTKKLTRRQRLMTPHHLRNYVRPNSTDVLFGRGSKTTHHPGNRRFRILANEMKPRYLQMTRADKNAMSVELVNHVHSWSGRFLVEDDTRAGKYYVAPDGVARLKASQCLRENKTKKS